MCEEVLTFVFIGPVGIHLIPPDNTFFCSCSLHLSSDGNFHFIRAAIIRHSMLYTTELHNTEDPSPHCQAASYHLMAASCLCKYTDCYCFISSPRCWRTAIMQCSVPPCNGDAFGMFSFLLFSRKRLGCYVQRMLHEALRQLRMQLPWQCNFQKKNVPVCTAQWRWCHQGPPCWTLSWGPGPDPAAFKSKHTNNFVLWSHQDHTYIHYNLKHNFTS